MSVFKIRAVLCLAVLAVFCGSDSSAQMVLRMDLPEICTRADKIFRGTVLSATNGTVHVGGGELPVVTYRLRVDEAFQGDYIKKGDEKFVEITMLGKLTRASANGARAVSPLPDLPQLRIGSAYLLLTSPPSSAGLSAPIGLGQGCFIISEVNKVEMATDGLGNALRYNELADQIRAALAQ